MINEMDGLDWLVLQADLNCDTVIHSDHCLNQILLFAWVLVSTSITEAYKYKTKEKRIVVGKVIKKIKLNS